MFKCLVKGIVMGDEMITSNYDGETKTYRSISIFQPIPKNKSLLEIKDAPEYFKTEFNTEIEIPVLGNAWANNGRSGVSFKFDLDTYNLMFQSVANSKSTK